MNAELRGTRYHVAGDRVQRGFVFRICGQSIDDRQCLCSRHVDAYLFTLAAFIFVQKISH